MFSRLLRCSESLATMRASPRARAFCAFIKGENKTPLQNQIDSKILKDPPNAANLTKDPSNGHANLQVDKKQWKLNHDAFNVFVAGCVVSYAYKKIGIELVPTNHPHFKEVVIHLYD